jgi:hypothetical protein
VGRSAAGGVAATGTVAATGSPFSALFDAAHAATTRQHSASALRDSNTRPIIKLPATARHPCH